MEMSLSQTAVASRPAAGLPGARRGFWQFVPLAALHLAALYLVLTTEYYEFPHIAGFVLAWGLVNFIWLAVLRRAAVAAMLSLSMILVLIALSRFKLQILAQNVDFMDIMIIDPQTIAFVFATFKRLYIYVAIGVLAVALALLLLWRFDPSRLPRKFALAGIAACLAGLVALSYSHPYEVNWWYYAHVSSFARSGVDAVQVFFRHGLLESDVSSPERLAATDTTCHPAGRLPHIIVVHDESAFDIRRAPNIKVPAGYERHFRSFDGRQRDLIVEALGAPSWYAEYNLLAGLSAHSYGRFSFFVTRIAAGRIERGLPNALRRCGYRTFTLYPYRGAFLSARRFHTSIGVQKFYDMREMHANEYEPDQFYYNAALRLIERERSQGPVFVYVYLSANHFPWDDPWRPELTPDWVALGNTPEVDEYLRRQVLGMRQYRDFLASLERQFSGEPFLLVRYGDHQPHFSPWIIDPDLSQTERARRMAQDVRYFTTYYAIDAINFRPVNTASAFDTIEAAHLPLVTLESAGVPLDPSFAEQRRILQRCRGLFYRCADGAEARRFNRLLIDAGLIKGL
jgi:hypothetical protein